MKFINHQARRSFSCILVLFALAGLSFGQKLAGNGPAVKTVKIAAVAPTALVTPIKFSGNPSCADLNAIQPGTQPPGPFSHIISDNELKLDFSDPNGTFSFTNSDAPFPRIVVGPQSGTATVTISSGSSQIFSWSSTRQITAVILKMGPNGYAYPYKPFKHSDTNLRPADVFPDATEGLSHVSFCFGDPTNPTAAEATIGGRVVTASGMGIARAQIVLINGATGEAKITMTNPFGYYTITGLDVNEVYVLNVSHKIYSFEERQRTIVLTDNFTASDFVAQPRE
jgi:hypothetical protein